MTYCLARSEIDILGLFWWISTEFGISIVTRRELSFSDIYFVACQWVFGLINIRDRIDSRLNLWNKVTYGKLAQDSDKAPEEVLGNKRGTQTKDQRHRTFSNLINTGSMSQAPQTLLFK